MTLGVSLYTIVDDLYQERYAHTKPRRPGRRPELSDSEVLTLAICAQWFGTGARIRALRVRTLAVVLSQAGSITPRRPCRRPVTEPRERMGWPYQTCVMRRCRTLGKSTCCKLMAARTGFLLPG